jgi:hypothetical protein
MSQYLFDKFYNCQIVFSCINSIFLDFFPIVKACHITPLDSCLSTSTIPSLELSNDSNLSSKMKWRCTIVDRLPTIMLISAISAPIFRGFRHT